MWVRRRRQPRAALIQDVAPVHPAARRPARRFITWPALALLTVGSVGYLGSAPALAVFGLASVFLYVLPALVFLVPVSLVAAELASGWPGGVYNAVVIIVLFWGGSGVLPRDGAGGKAASGGTLIGTLIPGAILVGLGVTYLLRGEPVSCADDRQPSVADMDRGGQHRAGREQLLHLRRRRSQRRAR